jgi:hypothetical protein
VYGLTGYTYNLENGKIVKSKLEKGSIFDEEINENWRKEKFTMPDVKEGSVIEYTYAITSPFTTEFRPWNFQHSIPVLHTEYRAVIPEFFNYRQIQQGYAQFQTEKTNVSQKFSIKYRGNPQAGGAASTGTYDLDSNSKKYRWWAKNLPALRKEPYITSLQNYYSRIEFMLANTNFGGRVKSYMGDYMSFNKTLCDGNSYGTQLKGGGFLKDAIEDIQGKYPEKEEQVVAIYNHVRDHMNWNGGYGKYVSNSLRSAYKEHSGNSSDINLLLVLMLREAGFEADPVVLASRFGYRIHPTYPISSKINYVIAQVKIEGNSILMDATDKNRPYYILPERALSGKGWVVSETHPGWTEIRNNETNSDKTMVKFKIEDDILVGEVSRIEENIQAFQSLKSLKEDEEEYKKQIKENADWDVTELEIKQGEGGQLSLDHSFKIESFEDISGSNIVYINPVIFSELTDNPFKLEKREFPVEYSCPENHTYMATLEVPPGYLVDDMPESSILSLPDNAAIFRMTASQNGNMVTVVISRTINKKLFSQNEYPNLREFYNQVASKCSEQIVLKRKS